MFSAAFRGPVTSLDGPNKNSKMGSTWKVNATDWQEVEMFNKNFTVRAACVIVQSRLGGKSQTACNADRKEAWFNLILPDGTEYIKEASRVWHESSPPKPICVEISLKTVEGDTMVLEMWTLGVAPEPCGNATMWKVDLYSRVCTLLKSVLSVSRCLPAYKLSRRQGPDSFVICYRMFSGDPQYHHLGEGYNQLRVGGVSTPRGTFLISLAYRTKMTISPQHSTRDNSIMLKSDHFRPDMSPQLITRRDKPTPPVSPKERASSFDSLKPGAFADPKIVTPPEKDIILDCPFSNLLQKKKVTSQTSTSPSTPVPSPANVQDDNELDNDVDNSQHSSDSNGNVTPRAASTTSTAHSRRSSCSLASANDDFIMKPTFSCSSADTELGEFLTQCQSAPPLQTFLETPTLEQQVEGLSQQLETYETNLAEYDQVFFSLCKDT